MRQLSADRATPRWGVKGEDYGRRIFVPRDPPDPNDYFGRWKGITNLRFEENQTSQSVYVQIHDDLHEDSGETMVLKAFIHRVEGLEWNDRPPPRKPEGTGTILNDEEVGQNSRVVVSDSEADEADGSMDFTISLTESVSGDVSVYYKTKNGSAAAGSDYESTSGWIDFLGGDTTKTISVPIIEDAVDERQETFTLEADDWINLAGAEKKRGTGTITDDDVTALTAEFQNMPSSHEGDGEDFSFQLRFNQKVTTKYRVMEDHVFRDHQRRGQRRTTASTSAATCGRSPSSLTATTTS